MKINAKNTKIMADTSETFEIAVDDQALIVGGSKLNENAGWTADVKTRLT